jgi:hypothetical protein
MKQFPLAFGSDLRDNQTIGAYVYAPLELNLAVVASRSSLVGALLRAASPVNRPTVLDFLRGLSRDELECLAEFQGACVLEAQEFEAFNPYRLLAEFFDPRTSDRWHNADDRAHKTFVLLAWLEQTQSSRRVDVRTESIHLV